MPERRFTRQELERYDGRHGAPVFLAFQGKVYDVSASYQWRRGKHQVTHRAGSDLTVELLQAPHGPEMLDRFPIVGILTDE